jgi:hypothetical protein
MGDHQESHPGGRLLRRYRCSSSTAENISMPTGMWSSSRMALITSLARALGLRMSNSRIPGISSSILLVQLRPDFNRHVTRCYGAKVFHREKTKRHRVFYCNFRSRTPPPCGWSLNHRMAPGPNLAFRTGTRTPRFSSPGYRSFFLRASVSSISLASSWRLIPSSNSIFKRRANASCFSVGGNSGSADAHIVFLRLESVATRLGMSGGNTRCSRNR